MKIIAFDAFRYILALCVLFGHSYINLYQKGTTLVGCQNLAVDGFFMLSGFLMAKSHLHLPPPNKSNNILLKRIQRLAPEYIFALIFTCTLSVTFHINFNIKYILYNIIFVAGLNKIPSVLVGAWYVSLFFWIGYFLSCLVMYSKEKSLYWYLPMLCFFSFLYEYNAVGSLSITGTGPLFLNVLPISILKAVFDIGFGILLYSFSNYLKNNPFHIRKKALPTIVFLLECLGLFLTVYAMTHGAPSRTDYLVLFGFAILIPIFYLRNERLLKILSLPFWEKFAGSAYMLFLTHCVLLEIIKRKIPYLNYPKSMVYLGVMLFCAINALACQWLCKKMFTGLKRLLIEEKNEVENVD